VILVNKLLPDIDVDTVVADHAAGGRQAAEVLLAAGCRRLAVVSSAARTASLMGRLDAFRARAGEVGVAVRVWQDGPTDYGAGRAAALALLREDALDGVFCVTDLLALGFLDAARAECGRCVPDDLSVIGFDDVAQASWRAYRLTTFRQPARDLTAAVMRLIHRRVDDANAPHTLDTVPVQLIARSTVRGLAPVEPLA
jgi:DNA-binding LacI/PurR family transcriptional regulator